MQSKSITERAYNIGRLSEGRVEDLLRRLKTGQIVVFYPLSMITREFYIEVIDHNGTKELVTDRMAFPEEIQHDADRFNERVGPQLDQLIEVNDEYAELIEKYYTHES